MRCTHQAVSPRDLDPRLADRRRRSARAAGRGTGRRRTRPAGGSRARGASRSGSRRGSARPGRCARPRRRGRGRRRTRRPSSWKSAYGLTVRSRSSSREIDQYGNLTVRCFEIAASSLLSRPCISVEYSGSSTSTRIAVCGRRLREAGPAEREVLQREPQRLGVGELALEQVERRLQRRELVVVRARAAAGSSARSAACRAPRR